MKWVLLLILAAIVLHTQNQVTSASLSTICIMPTRYPTATTVLTETAGPQPTLPRLPPTRTPRPSPTKPPQVFSSQQGGHHSAPELHAVRNNLP
jgi:hypothetical protein